MGHRFAVAMGITLLAALVFGAQAHAQGWNYYSGFNSLPNIPFTNGAMTPDRTASVFLNLNGAVNAFTLDTGSTGIAASSKYYKPGPNDVAQGPGQVSYSSSGLSYKGTWYTTNVGIVQTAQVASGGNSAVPGSQLATSQGVSVLAVTEQCDKSGKCNPAPADAISYMGVGYNRNALRGRRLRAPSSMLSQVSRRSPRARI